MASEWFEAIPAAQVDAARAAVVVAFGASASPSIHPVTGGASAALTYRLEWNHRAYMLRVETRRNPMRNPHQYVCMRIASDAPIAPPLRYADDATGVAILDFVAARPLTQYPGGPAGLATAVGKLVAALQRTPSFPQLGDYRVFLERMLAYIRRAFAPGLLDPHAELFERIRQAYAWDTSTHVSSHNDPNPGNILFDGERLWLIDWETSYRNDPLTDVAILIENFAPTPELEEILTASWLGVPPDETTRARLQLMRSLTRLYYAGLLLASSITPGAEPISDLSTPSPAGFQPDRGTVTQETMLTLGKMCLASFLASANTATLPVLHD